MLTMSRWHCISFNNLAQATERLSLIHLQLHLRIRTLLFWQLYSWISKLNLVFLAWFWLGAEGGKLLGNRILECCIRLCSSEFKVVDLTGGVIDLKLLLLLSHSLSMRHDLLLLSLCESHKSSSVLVFDYDFFGGAEAAVWPQTLLWVLS